MVEPFMNSVSQALLVVSHYSYPHFTDGELGDSNARSHTFVYRKLRPDLAPGHCDLQASC